MTATVYISTFVRKLSITNMTNQTSRRKLLKQLAAGTLATAVSYPFQACATSIMEE